MVEHQLVELFDAGSSPVLLENRGRFAFVVT